MSSSGRSFVGSILFTAGLFLVFLGERAFGTGTGRGVCTGIGLALILVAVVLRFLRSSRATGDARGAERILLALDAVGLLGLVAYFVQSDLSARVFGRPLGDTSPRAAVVFAALCPVLVALSVLPILLVEWSYASMARAPVIELGRIREGLFSGIGLAAAIIFAFAIVYAATVRDVKVDLSYFRTAKPGDATRKIVRALDAPVTVSMFFPPANEVKDELMEYFGDLAKESPQLQIKNYDKDVDLAKAKELGITGNGQLLFQRAGRKELMTFGLKLESTRSQLRSLDVEAQRRLLFVSRPARVVYLTTGHDERSGERTMANDQRAGINQFKEAMRSLNYEVKNLGAAEGLAGEVPKDAAAVAIIGPQRAFLPEELAALSAYLEGGGRLLVAVDPDSKVDLSPVLKPLGVKLDGVTLCNDQVFARRTHQVSDRANIGSASYSSHPSVLTLQQLGARAPLILLGAGAVEALPDKPKGVAVDFTVHGHPLTWNDANGNFEFDPPAEIRKSWELAAAVTWRKEGSKDEARAIVIGDSDFISDLLFEQSFGSYYFSLDGMKWLLGDDLFAGQVNSEQDVRIEHTKKEDVVWFYLTIFAMPAVVVVAGSLITRRGRKRRAAGGGGAS